MKVVILFACIAMAASFHITDVPVGYKVKSVDTYDCRWICDDDGAHWKEFMECEVDEVAAGACGVSGSRDCKDPLIGREICPNGERGYTGLRCCKAEVILQKI